jgi:hypothetical protein
MPTDEEFQGFVPVSLFLPGQRVEGRIWKFANRRLLQQIEQDRREFVPVVEARLFAVEGDAERAAGQFDVLAVRKSAVTAIVPQDTVTPVAERA